MIADNAQSAPPHAGEEQHTRRAKVAPLLAAGMSLRAISAEIGIPIGAVHRAKRQIEKACADPKAGAVLLMPPPSYVVQQEVDGVPQPVRRLSTSVRESAVTAAIGRGLLEPWDRDKAWTVTSSLFASMFRDHTIHWLHKHGFLPWGERGKAEAIIAAVNELIMRQR